MLKHRTHRVYLAIGIAVLTLAALRLCFMPQTSCPTCPDKHQQQAVRKMTTTAAAVKGPAIDFYIRTWKGDGHWLTFMLRSIEAHVPSHVYRNIIVTYERKEDAFFRSYLPLVPLPLVLVPEDDVYIRAGPNNGSYYSQMYSKFFPWKHSDAEYFIHFDSDCVFTQPIARNDFMDDQGRVYIQARKYPDLSKGHQVWRAPAEALLREPVPAETMTGFPFTYPRELYVQFIAHVEQVHNKPFLDVLRSMENFNEFTTLGHYLMNHMPGRWVYNDTKSKKVKQQFSWGGLTPEAAAECEIAIRSSAAAKT